MMGKIIGYVRVSSVDQNTDRQLTDVRCDRIFQDKVSGKSTARPALQELLSSIETGDRLVVHSMDRLARNLDDLRKIVFDLTARGITVEFRKESMVYSADKSNPMATLLLSIMGAFAEFERAIIHERQREGIAIARTKNAFKGRSRILNDEQVSLLIDKMESERVPILHLARDIAFLGIRSKNGALRTKITRTTLILERNEYVNKHPEICVKYPRLQRFLKEE